MRIIVCGGRNWSNLVFVWRSLDRLHAELRITDLLQGGCPTGVDSFAKSWAKTKPEIRRFESEADWKTHGPAAGPIRNAHMLTWRPDLVAAFPGGRGTADMARKAKDAGVPVRFIP